MTQGKRGNKKYMKELKERLMNQPGFPYITNPNWKQEIVDWTKEKYPKNLEKNTEGKKKKKAVLGLHPTIARAIT